MKINCPKCRKSYDPETQMAHCSPHYGHAPTKAVDQHLTEAMLATKETVPVRRSERTRGQADFMMIWDEPAKRHQKFR